MSLLRFLAVEGNDLPAGGRHVRAETNGIVVSGVRGQRPCARADPIRGLRFARRRVWHNARRCQWVTLPIS
eukprot:370542-Rhodomonas_salina.3